MFQNLGGKCVFSSEWDKYAKLSYETNFGETPFGDIDGITDINKQIPKHDILCAGFPCQAFSIAGYRHGFNDKKGRGNLFFNIAEILEVKKPKTFLLENVKNLKTHDKGRTYQTICHHLTQLGYGIKTKVLNAKDFGLHQNRERIFIVGVKDTWEDSPIPLPSEEKVLNYKEIDKLLNDKYKNRIADFEFPKKNEKPLVRLDKINRSGMGQPILTKLNGINIEYLNPPKALQKYLQKFEDRDDWKHYIYNGKCGHFEKAVRFINGKINGEDNNCDWEHWESDQWKDESYQYVYQWRRKYVRRNNGGVCPTLTANMGTGGHNVPLIICGTVGNEKLIRKLTPEECLAFQGYDKNFRKKFGKISIANGEKYKQAGNSVPVTVVKLIAEKLSQILIKE